METRVFAKLAKQAKTKYARKPIVCYKCGKKFLATVYYAKHMKEQH